MDMKIQTAIGENICYLRKISGYTQEEISDKIHVSRSTYASYERGSKIPPTNTLIDLAGVYGINMSTLVECNRQRFLSDVMASDDTRGKIEFLIKIFNQLSPFSKGQLIERAEILMELEEGKMQPEKKE